MKVPNGLEIRPTTDKIRQAVFNILQGEVRDSRFLDLCCGTGVMGIEALSRGADSAVFVDNRREVCELVARNLAPLPYADRVQIVEKDVIRFLNAFHGFEGGGQRLIAYFDPPYNDRKLYQRVLSAMDRVNPKNLFLFVEHGGAFNPAPMPNLKKWKEKRYGSKWISAFTTIPEFW